MTLLVGIQCTDGVVVAADSMATFGNPGVPTITHPVRKITIIDEKVIVACTGTTGFAQRFDAVVESLYSSAEWKGSAIEKGKAMSARGLKDLAQTGIKPGGLASLVGFFHQGKAQLCEFQLADFQPDLKGEGIWYVSLGSGQALADPYLALMRLAFWRKGRPDLEGGIFAAAWVMTHAIEVAPAFISKPIDIAVLEDGKARFLEEDELQEHHDHVKASMEHFRAFETILLGTDGTPALPEPPAE